MSSPMFRALRQCAPLLARRSAGRCAIAGASVAQATIRPTASQRALLAAVATSTSLLLVSATSDSALCEKVPIHCLREADKLFDGNQYTALAGMLRGSLSRAPDDAELLWRLCRALKKLADAEPDKKAKEALLKEALEHAAAALKHAPESSPSNKWYAIALSEVGQFAGTSATIKNSFVVREHFERAVKFDPSDATARHLLGVWCFEVAKLSWLEQKAAAALFATPPTATYDEAIAHFERAEAMDPGFYPKNLLLLAQACARAGKTAEAKAWLAKCQAATPRTPEDEETLEQARKLKL